MNTQGISEIVETSNLKAATAILTFGFPLINVSVSVRGDGTDSKVFWYNPKNESGQSSQEVKHDMTKGADALAAADHEAQLLALIPQNKHHLFYKAVTNYMRAYALNRDSLVSIIKRNEKVVIEHGDKTLIISKNASDETKRKAAKFL